VVCGDKLGNETNYSGGEAMKRILLAAAIALIALPAFAQAPKPRPHITGNPVEDIKADIADVTGNKVAASGAGNVLTQLRAKFTADLTADLTSALALAQAQPTGCTATPPTQTTGCGAADTTAVPCSQALISLNGVINSYTPPTDKPHVISDLEQLRIVGRAIQSTAFKDACAPLVQDINSQATQLIASILSIVGGAAKIGIAIP
jgi:hypothetical protein